MTKIMLIGLGDLGSVLLELLVREANLGPIIVGSRDKKRGTARCNLARLSAIAQGFDPDIRFLQLDLNNKEATAEIIQREAPNLILSTATMQTWWLPELLPGPQAAEIKSVGFGVWLPVHLTLTMKLMEAVRDAHYKGFTLTAPFPDVVNCILGRLDLAPTCGFGNLDEVVPKVRLLASERLGASSEEIRVFLVAHHALQRAVFGSAKDIGTAKIPPYYLRVEHLGQNVTAEIQADDLLLASYPISPGRASHFLTAGCAMRLIRAFFSEEDMLIHTPGPSGLPGGYPVIVSKKGLQLAPIQDLSLEEAISINEQSHRFDGIERIEGDGTTIFCSDSATAFRDILGYYCEKLTPNEAEGRAHELIARFKEYARRHGVELGGEAR